MADEDDERAEHLRAVAITTIAAIAGVAAAVGSSTVTAEMEPAVAAGERMAHLVVLVAIVVQLPVYQLVYDDWGGAKDVLYVAFMTFAIWFVTWGIILASGAQIL